MTARSTLRETILKTLPASVTVEDDTIPVGIAWMLKPPKDLPKPCWMVQFGPESDQNRVLNEYEDGAIVPVQITNEPHTYVGADFLNVEEWDIAEVISVVGTRAGSPNHPFSSATDYEVIDTDGDGALDAISWKAGGNRPDNGTAVLITYTHRMWETVRGHPLRSIVYVHAVADKLVSGQQSATEEHDPTEIIDAMQTALRVWYTRDLRPALEAADIGVGLRLNFQAPLKLDGTSTVQVVATFEADYALNITLGQTRTARKVTVDTDLDYPA